MNGLTLEQSFPIPRMISHASAPTARLAPSGMVSPYDAVTDHVPGPSSEPKSLQNGQSSPSVRTTIRLLSTRYDDDGRTTPSILISVIDATGDGRRNSEILPHVQSPEQPPHVRLNQAPPIRAG